MFDVVVELTTSAIIISNSITVIAKLTLHKLESKRATVAVLYAAQIPVKVNIGQLLEKLISSGNFPPFRSHSHIIPASALLYFSSQLFSYSHPKTFALVVHSSLCSFASRQQIL